MLTLQRLKEIVDTPKMDQKMPSAKRLAECEKTVAWKKLGEDMEVAAYKNGYALYRVHQAATVFPIHACGGYQYGMGDSPRIGSEQFGQEAWYLRLVLEGEDRLCRNQEARERRKTVSYSAESEDWEAMATGSDPVLGRVIMEEDVDEHLALLTDKQRLAVRKYYLGQETQAQIAQEFGIGTAAVSRLLSRAIQRMRGAEPLATSEA